MSACARCGAGFTCGMRDTQGSDPCWCTGLPALQRDALKAGDARATTCFCPACLRGLLDDQQAAPTTPVKSS